MGHYEAPGSTWDEGEVPKCAICGEQAEYDTAYLGVQVCGNAECAAEFVLDCCDLIEYIPDEDEEEE